MRNLKTSFRIFSFKKSNMNNTGKKFGGRKAGVQNKDKTNLRAIFELLVENNIEALQEDLNSLKPLDRIKAIIELSKFVLPTLKAIEHKDSNDKERISPVVINFKTVDYGIEN
jgi:hypothetical protein